MKVADRELASLAHVLHRRRPESFGKDVLTYRVAPGVTLTLTNATLSQVERVARRQPAQPPPLRVPSSQKAANFTCAKASKKSVRSSRTA
jgi:hypothetical protein